MTDYRTELQRLVKAYDEHGGRWPDHHVQALFQAAEAARTALAQPEPEGVGEAAELVEWLYKSSREWRDLGEYDEGAKCHRAADTLTRYARPTTEPVPVAEDVPHEEILRLAAEEIGYEFTGQWFLTGGKELTLETNPLELLNFAHAILARWGRPTIEPVPVAERPWEREGWCDAEQACWAIGHRDRWERVYVPGRDWSNPTYTHLLPHHALPVPGAEEGS